MFRSVYWITLSCLIAVIVHLSWVSVVPLYIAELIYAYCKFDISTNSLKINAHMPDTYWSINMYDEKTRNFYVLSNRQAEVNELIFLLKNKKTEDEEEFGEISALNDQAINISTQSETGLILLRAFVPFRSKAEEIRTKLASTSCEPV